MIVAVVALREDSGHPYACRSVDTLVDFTVDEDGYQFHDNMLSDYDLVKLEYSPADESAQVEPDVAPKPPLAVGQVWVARNGRTVRITEYNAVGVSAQHPWICEDSKSVVYTVNNTGFEFTQELETPHDLVRFVEAKSPTAEIKIATDDAAEQAVELLLSLGWHFTGECWVQDPSPDSAHCPTQHPLYAVFVAAIEQAMFGKGERHGGALTPFLEQPWVHYAKMHGRGFLTGQAAKKLEEAASTRDGQAFEQEVLGAIVYCGMAVLKNRGAV
jgi:hypothetical protein